MPRYIPIVVALFAAAGLIWTILTWRAGMTKVAPGKRKDRPRAKIVCFDIPRLIYVVDNMDDAALRAWADAVNKGEEPPYSRYAPALDAPGTMVLLGGAPVWIPSQPFAPPYQVRVDGLEGAIYFLKRVNPRKSIVPVAEVLGDRAGKSSFSSVQVVIPVEGRASIPDLNDMHHWVQEAVKLVNHFISHYRVVADRPLVQPVTRAEVQEFTIITEWADGERFSQVAGTGSGAAHGLGGSIPNGIDAALRAAVANERPPNFLVSLHADILDHADLQRWRSALIEIAIHFEAFLAFVVRKGFKDNHGLTDAEIDLKLRPPGGRPLRVTQIAGKLVTEATGVDFKGTTEYRNWRTKVAKVRNELVHGSRFKVSEQEAQHAFDVANAAKETLLVKGLKMVPVED